MTDPHAARRRRLRARFLVALGEHGIVARAAREARGGRRLFYDWREKDSDFAAAWDKALTLGLAALEDAAMTRALDGAKRIVWYQGKPVGTERRPSDAMLMFLLRSRLPARYGRAATRAGAETGGRGAEDGYAPPDERLTPEQHGQDIRRMLIELGLGAVPLPQGPADPLYVTIRDVVLGGPPDVMAMCAQDGGFRDGLLGGASPDVLARAPGVDKGGP